MTLPAHYWNFKWVRTPNNNPYKKKTRESQYERPLYEKLNHKLTLRTLMEQHPEIIAGVANDKVDPEVASHWITATNSFDPGSPSGGIITVVWRIPGFNMTRRDYYKIPERWKSGKPLPQEMGTQKYLNALSVMEQHNKMQARIDNVFTHMCDQSIDRCAIWFDGDDPVVFDIDSFYVHESGYIMVRLRKHTSEDFSINREFVSCNTLANSNFQALPSYYDDAVRTAVRMYLKWRKQPDVSSRYGLNKIMRDVPNIKFFSSGVCSEMMYDESILSAQSAHDSEYHYARAAADSAWYRMSDEARDELDRNKWSLKFIKRNYKFTQEELSANMHLINHPAYTLEKTKPNGRTQVTQMQKRIMKEIQGELNASK